MEVQRMTQSALANIYLFRSISSLDKEKGSYKEVPHHEVEMNLIWKAINSKTALKYGTFYAFYSTSMNLFELLILLFGNSLSLSPITT